MKIHKNKTIINTIIHLPTSKSECNRALLIEALLGEKNLIKNISSSEDTQTLVRILNQFSKNESHFDVGPAGTTMRFLTAFFSLQKGQQIITGSERMKQRPIGILVDALQDLGAAIDYLEKDGFPPIRINESNLSKNQIQIDGGVSSQYISALMLIAPMLQKGLIITIINDLVSKPYLEMTAQLMQYFGAKISFTDKKIHIEPSPYTLTNYNVEADWSAASYWYELIALSNQGKVELIGLKQNSLQGDAVVAKIYTLFGVETQFTATGVIIQKTKTHTQPSSFNYDFTSCPDLAQTLAVTCSALDVKAKLTGLKTLKIKETDRIVALQNELKKIGVNTTAGEDFLIIHPALSLSNSRSIKTYHDHRMAMAFAPLGMVFDTLEIENPTVVGKSYPSFWDDLQKVGFSYHN